MQDSTADKQEGLLSQQSSTTHPTHNSNLPDNDTPVDLQGHVDSEAEPGEQIEPGAPDTYLLIKASDPSGFLHRTLRHLAVLGLLVFSSIWGLLAREGLVALNTYSGMSVEPTIWAQAVGCLVMGYTVANKEDLELWYPPAFIMIGTGFCGSLTTFSSFILHVFQAYSNQIHYNRHGLHNVMDALSQTALTIGMSLISLFAGRALAKSLPLRPLLYVMEHNTTHRALLRRAARDKESSADKDTKHAQISSLTQVAYSPVPDVASILLGIVFWAAAAVLCGTYAPFRHVTYAVVLSPPGAILRWYLSRLNSLPVSKRFPYWPMGTFTANQIAQLVLAAAFVGQRVGRTAGQPGARSIDGCHALYGLQEGFCGCLSTISTFAVELSNLKPYRRAFGYALGSYVVGIVICILIIGSPWWSIGMEGSCVGITLK